jgi:hypothetical protein
MYRIIGADGKEYGPVTLEQFRVWITQSRVNPQTQVKAEGSTEWSAAGNVPELNALFAAAGSAAAIPPLTPLDPSTALVTGPANGLAITSLVFGILSLICAGIFAGVPAIICGHVARSRAQRMPAVYGGAGFALAGLILGYIGVAVTFLILPAMLLPALAGAKARAQSINCVNNMKQIGLAFKVWALDHNDQFPFNVSTNGGGTFELCSTGADGFDYNATVHFRVLSNELSTTRILVCPCDTKQPALSWQFLSPANLSYQMHSGTNFSDSNPQAVLVICPLHGHRLLTDGTVQEGKRKRPPFSP